MSDVPRFDELFRIAKDEMTARNTLLRPEVVDTPGTDANALAAAIATVGEEVVYQAAIVARDRMISTSVGEALDELAFDFYGLVRNDAAAALVTLRFTRSGGAGGSIPAGSICKDGTGLEFATTTELVFAPATTVLSVTARCTEAGTKGNVAATTITILGFAPFDATMVVTNLAAAAGGSERETDPDFRSRIRQWWSTLRRGTLSAIEFGAMEVDGVGVARATETPLLVDTDGDGVKDTTLGLWVSETIADRQGTANAALAALVLAALDDYRPCGVYVEVLAATTTWQSIVLACAWVAGEDATAATTRIKQAVANYVNGLRVGEALRVGKILDIVQSDRAVVFTTVTVTLPSGDVVPSSSGLIRTTESLVRVN